MDDRRCASRVPTVRHELIGKPTPKPVRAMKATAAVAPSSSAERSGRPWAHNGSLMFADEETGLIVYDAPKASLAPAVRSGTVLFRGSLRDGKVRVTAYALKAGCPPAPYPVTGAYSDRMYTFMLRGAGPVRNGCEVVAYSERSPHAVLRFSYVIDD